MAKVIEHLLSVCSRNLSFDFWALERSKMNKKFKNNKIGSGEGHTSVEEEMLGPGGGESPALSFPTKGKWGASVVATVLESPHWMTDSSQHRPNCLILSSTLS